MKATMKQLVKPIIISLASNLGPHVRKSLHPKLWILMYHRSLPIYDERYHWEEPGMIVRPETFEMHIREAKKQFDMVSLRQWVKAYQSGERLPERACAITFDDGWADNYEYAFPVLKSESVPATLFVVAEKIGTDFQFWPNIVAALILGGSVSQIASNPLFHSVLKNIPEKPSADEVAHVIRELKRFSDNEIYNALDVVEWKALCKKEMSPALMNWEQLHQMASSGLVEVGSHTCTHKRLTNALTQAELEYEIIHSKSILEEKLKSPVNLFCFPNGNYNEAALSLVKKYYQAAVTTKRGINISRAMHLHELVRIGIHDEVSNNRTAFRARLSGWV